MKYLAIFLFLSVGYCSAQTIVAHDVKVNNVLYRYFPSSIEINLDNGDVVSLDQLSCDQCFIEKDTTVVSLRSVFRITPKEAQHAVLLIHDQAGNLLKEHLFRVMNVPEGELYLGNTRAGEIYQKGDLNLRVLYPEESFLESEIEIKEWKLFVGDKKLFGHDSELSEEAIEMLREATGMTEVRITCIGKDERGIKRGYQAAFLAN